MGFITSQRIYLACMNGAKLVMNNKEHLNEINVFPVQDGDTGSNLSSMMRAIINEARTELTPKATVTTVSDAALRGARGNSGIIFAQYLSGISTELVDGSEISIEHFADASDKAARYAYDAIEDPVEGTMITVMKVWGQALVRLVQKDKDALQSMDHAYEELEESLKATQYQLKDLRKAGVVDSGAKGFVYFIKGMLDYFKNHETYTMPAVEDEPIEFDTALHLDQGPITHRYCTEGLIEGDKIDIPALRKGLKAMGDSLVVAGNANKCRIHIHSDAPAAVFDYLYQFGNITYQKADDMVKQQDIVTNRHSNIALLTDSIADLPMSYIDQEQIHIINLHLLFQDTSFIDKLTITNERILDYARTSSKLPTSSQPDPKHIENVLGYLKTYYESVIVLTVSSALSGTYSNVSKVAQSIADEDFKVTVIDTKQNSGAQGLLVAKAAHLIKEGLSHQEIVEEVMNKLPKSKILVRVKTLDNMVKSGRLSTKAGKVGKLIGLKPIVTLDKDGNGALDGVAFSTKGSLKKLLKQMASLIKEQTIESYSIVHINNPDEAEDFVRMFTKVIGKAPDFVCETSSIVAVGAGDGAVAISYILE